MHAYMYFPVPSLTSHPITSPPNPSFPSICELSPAISHRHGHISIALDSNISCRSSPSCLLSPFVEYTKHGLSALLLLRILRLHMSVHVCHQSIFTSGLVRPFHPLSTATRSERLLLVLQEGSHARWLVSATFADGYLRHLRFYK